MENSPAFYVFPLHKNQTDERRSSSSYRIRFVVLYI